MNRVEDTIGWAEKTWNPVTGCYHWKDTRLCAVGKHCYALRMSKRLKGRFGYPEVNPFQPVFHSDRFKEPQSYKKPRSIFVCSMGDLFGDFISDSWIMMVLQAASKAPQHTYMFLTKNPLRYSDEKILANLPVGSYIGTTVTSESDSLRIEQLKEADLSMRPDIKLYLSGEPILGSFGYLPPDLLIGIDLVIVGPETGSGKRPMESEWQAGLVGAADKAGCRVHIKGT